jgi:benzodiazapine receptor
MLFNLLGMLFSALGFACAALILVHAFRRSVGTGFMVLCIPCYILYYAFSQFEHGRKNLIIAGLVGGLLLAGTMRAVSADLAVLELPVVR